MGWFNSATENVKFTKEEAYAGVLLGAIAADGDVAEEEIASLGAILTRMNLYKGWTSRDFDRTFRRVGVDLKKNGLDATVPKLADALPMELRESAFLNACDLVLADGVVRQEESRYVDQLQFHLGIEDELARTAVHVLSAKNRG